MAITPDIPPSPPITIEAQLVRRAQAGDPVAFRRLFERHAPAVRRLLRDLLRNPEAADEAVQETFVRAHARLSHLRDDDRLAPWLFGIARNVFYETLRQRRQQSALPDRVAQAQLPAPSPASPGAGGPSPESLLLGREADAQLAEALAALDEDRRTALLLRLDHGLDYAEIQAVMGWNLAKVKNEIHRARLVLRERLASYVGGA